MPQKDILRPSVSFRCLQDVSLLANIVTEYTRNHLDDDNFCRSVLPVLQAFTPRITSVHEAIKQTPFSDVSASLLPKHKRALSVDLLDMNNKGLFYSVFVAFLKVANDDTKEKTNQFDKKKDAVLASLLTRNYSPVVQFESLDTLCFAYSAVSSFIDAYIESHQDDDIFKAKAVKLLACFN